MKIKTTHQCNIDVQSIAATGQVEDVVRQVGDEEYEAAARRRQIRPAEQRGDQETERGGRNAEGEQEDEHQDGIRSLQYISQLPCNE